MHFLPLDPLNVIQNIPIIGEAINAHNDLQKRVHTLIKLSFPSIFPLNSPEKIKNPIVRELTDNEKKDLIEISNIWHAFAKNKGDEYAKATFQREILYENPFFHAVHINKDIKQALESKRVYPNDPPPPRVFVCCVGNDIQAIN